MSTEISLKMSELNINNRLPPEMLAKILLSLDEVNLKNATLTCKLWNDVISTTYRWSLNLHYKRGELMCPNFNSEQKINFVMTTPRRFGTIKIRIGRRGDYNHIIKILEEHGSHVVNLRLWKCRIGIGLDRLLKLTPNLTDVRINNGKLYSLSDLPLDEDLPDLSKLENLTMTKSDLRITYYFRKARLQKLIVLEHSEHMSALVNFLSCQERLTSVMYFSGRSIPDDTGNWNVPIPFRLTRLTIADAVGELFSTEGNNFITTLVESQAENLKELKLFGVPNSVHEFVSGSMTKLDSLSVAPHELPRYNDFYERIKENHTVRVMKLVHSPMPSNLEYLGKFLQKFPNIRRLVLFYVRLANQYTLLAARNISKLESLALNIVDERLKDAIDCLNFTQLKTLNIQDLGAKINWGAFTKIHSRLAELTIETLRQTSFLTSDDIDQITTNVDLQTLRLGNGFVADDRFFEIVRSKCANLKVLELHISCVSQLSHRTRSEKKIDELRLYDDINRWQELYHC